VLPPTWLRGNFLSPPFPGQFCLFHSRGKGIFSFLRGWRRLFRPAGHVGTPLCAGDGVLFFLIELFRLKKQTEKRTSSGFRGIFFFFFSPLPCWATSPSRIWNSSEALLIFVFLVEVFFRVCKKPGPRWVCFPHKQKKNGEQGRTFRFTRLSI